MSDADEFFGGGASPLSFADRGTMNIWRGGEILAEPKKIPKNKYKTTEPDFWDDGTPKEQLVITLQTQERIPNDNTDLGVRRLFVPSGELKKAIGVALTKARSGMTVGGQLYVMWTGERPSKGGGEDAKLYQAHYVPDAGGQQAKEFFQQSEPATQVQPPASQPWTPPNGVPSQQGPPTAPNGAPQGPPAPAPWQQPAPQPVAAQAPAPWAQGPPSNGAPQPAAPSWQQQQSVAPAQNGPLVEASPPWAQTPTQQPSAQAPWMQQGPPSGAPTGQVYQGPPAGDPQNPFGPPQQYVQQNPQQG